MLTLTITKFLQSDSVRIESTTYDNLGCVSTTNLLATNSRFSSSSSSSTTSTTTSCSSLANKPTFDNNNDYDNNSDNSKSDNNFPSHSINESVGNTKVQIYHQKSTTASGSTVPLSQSHLCASSIISTVNVTQNIKSEKKDNFTEITINRVYETAVKNSTCIVKSSKVIGTFYSGTGELSSHPPNDDIHELFDDRLSEHEEYEEDSDVTDASVFDNGAKRFQTHVEEKPFLSDSHSQLSQSDILVHSGKMRPDEVTRAISSLESTAITTEDSNVDQFFITKSLDSNQNLILVSETQSESVNLIPSQSSDILSSPFASQVATTTPVISLATSFVQPSNISFDTSSAIPITQKTLLVTNPPIERTLPLYSPQTVISSQVCSHETTISSSIVSPEISIASPLISQPFDSTKAAHQNNLPERIYITSQSIPTEVAESLPSSALTIKPEICSFAQLDQSIEALSRSISSPNEELVSFENTLVSQSQPEIVFAPSVTQHSLMITSESKSEKATPLYPQESLILTKDSITSTTVIDDNNRQLEILSDILTEKPSKTSSISSFDAPIVSSTSPTITSTTLANLNVVSSHISPSIVSTSYSPMMASSVMLQPTAVLATSFVRSSSTSYVDSVIESVSSSITTSTVVTLSEPQLCDPITTLVTSIPHPLATSIEGSTTIHQFETVHQPESPVCVDLEKNLYYNKSMGKILSLPQSIQMNLIDFKLNINNEEVLLSECIQEDGLLHLPCIEEPITFSQLARTGLMGQNCVVIDKTTDQIVAFKDIVAIARTVDNESQSSILHLTSNNESNFPSILTITSQELSHDYSKLSSMEVRLLPFLCQWSICLVPRPNTN